MVVRTYSRALGAVRALLLIALLLAFAALIVLLSVRYFQVSEVRVPEVVGERADDAVQALRGLGFEVDTFTDEAGSASPGNVSSQSPEAGTFVRQGRGVSLGVGAFYSSNVPNLIGLSQEQATAQLTPLQLGAISVAYRDAPQAPGTVLGQTPAPGSELTSTAEVSLIVSRGPQPERVTLPNLSGKRLPAARQQLEALGFRRIEAVPTQLGSPGVNAQLPAAGERVPLSTQVTLYYSVNNPQVVRVPQLTGLSAQEAARRLNAAGLQVGWVRETSFDPTRPRGVSAVVPAEYTLWGSPVTLEVNGAAGTVQTRAPAPPRPSAQGTLGSGSFDPDSFDGDAFSQGSFDDLSGTSPGTNAQPGGQDAPASGQLANAQPLPGQAALPAEGGRQIPIDYDPANYGFLRGRAYAFRVEVADEEGERVVIDRSMAPDQPVQDSVTVYGEAELRMYIDGQIILAYNPPNP